MEPVGLALTRGPFNLGAVLFLLLVAGGVFAASRWLGQADEEDKANGE